MTGDHASNRQVHVKICAAQVYEYSQNIRKYCISELHILDINIEGGERQISGLGLLGARDRG